MNKILIQCKNLYKRYQDGNIQTYVLNNISFNMFEGEVVAIIGNSGSGKSTLLHLLGGLDTPTSGDIIFLGKLINKMSLISKAEMRNREIGFVYQFHHLLSDFTVLENIAMPLLIGKKCSSLIKENTKEMLKAVGLWYCKDYYPSALSGGERQRVAIARALIANPRLVLADEPTGNLDAYTANNIFCLIKKLNKTKGTAFLIVTHDVNLAKKINRQVKMHDGHLFELSSTQR